MSGSADGSEAELDSTEEKSQYITVFQQLTDGADFEEGGRLMMHGEQLDRRHKYVDGEFIPVSKPIAIIDVGVEIDQDGLSNFVTSDAGRAVLAPYFDEIEPEDTLLPDAEVDDVEF